MQIQRDRVFSQQSLILCEILWLSFRRSRIKMIRGKKKRREQMPNFDDMNIDEENKVRWT